MNIDDLMTRDVHACRLDDSMNEAARIMWDHDCGCVPVVDDEGRAVAMITDRDLCMAAHLRGLPLAAMSVESAASHGVVAAYEGQGVEAVELLMRKYRLRRLPVVDALGKLVGIVSLSDLARRLRPTEGEGGLNAESIVATLAAVGERHAAEAGWAEAAE
jgi:CBS domain-containing protein